MVSRIVAINKQQVGVGFDFYIRTVGWQVLSMGRVMYPDLFPAGMADANQHNRQIMFNITQEIISYNFV